MIIAHPTFDKDDQSIENKDQSIEIEDQSIEKNESQTHITHHNKLEMERECKEIFIGFRNDHSGIENSERSKSRINPSKRMSLRLISLIIINWRWRGNVRRFLSGSETIIQESRIPKDRNRGSIHRKE